MNTPKQIFHELLPQIDNDRGRSIMIAAQTHLERPQWQHICFGTVERWSEDQ